VNRAFGLALRKRFCVSFDFELQAAATDDAIVLSMGTSYGFPLSDAFHFVRADHLQRTLEQAILQAPMFGTRWRWNSSRALAVLRHDRGRKVPPALQRMRAEDLLAAVFPAQVACGENATGPIELPDHPLVRQTVHDCLFEAMDTHRLYALLQRIERGDIRLYARDTTEPSPFAHEILNAKPYAFLDDAPLEERRTRALSLRRALPEHQRDLGALDAGAIARAVAQARLEPRDPHELHDALLGLVVAPVREAWARWLGELEEGGRAATFGRFAVAIENAGFARILYPAAAAVVSPPHLDRPAPSRDDAVLAIVRGHSEVVGPFTVPAFARELDLPEFEIAVATARLEAEGVVLRGRFTPGGSGEEYCDRRLLARIHRLTLDRLRSEIEPVGAQDYVRYLFERHHLTRRTHAGGRAGLRDAVAMLQGFEIAAAAWEGDVLGPRVAGYRAEWLDDACLAGEVAWTRLSPRRCVTSSIGSTSRATPISLVLRRDLGWLIEAVRREPDEPVPMAEGPAAALEALRRKGALFFDDLASASRLPSRDLVDALWDLVGRALVASDGFQPLRDLMAAGPRAARRGAQGRWALTERSAEPTASDDLADRVAGQLLSRYGVLFRELVGRESFSVPWREVLRALRRREARGLVRGGRFVAGFIGEQYALPEAVDALRRVRRTDRTGEIVRVRPCDPLNLIGVVLPGPRIPAHHTSWLVFRDGAYAGAEERSVA
jgi:ATP-dependent helicase Lhr and Lhr-like helicase